MRSWLCEILSPNGFSSLSLQRASNLENSTYDLYTIPKDADSQNPDGRHFFFPINPCVGLLLCSCPLLCSPTVCMCVIYKTSFVSLSLSCWTLPLCFLMPLQHASFGRLPAHYITPHWLEKFMFIPNFYCSKYIFYNLVIRNFAFPLSTQQAAFLACQQRWILTRYGLF